MKEKKEQGIVTQFRQDRKILIIAVVCGILAVILVHLYLKSKAELYGSLVPVLVASQDIEKGEAFSQQSVKVDHIPQAFVSPNAIGPDGLLSILDMKSSVLLTKGQMILWPYVQTEEVTESLSEVLNHEHNERAVTIAVDEISGIAGHILPNDRVDVIGTFTIPPSDPNKPAVTKTKTILQCVTVLAVGTMSGMGLQQAGRFGLSGPPTSVTLKVKPEEGELLTFAENSGNLRLLLRNRDDLAVDEQIPVIDFNNLFEIEKKQTQARKDYIRIIYGK